MKTHAKGMFSGILSGLALGLTVRFLPATGAPDLGLVAGMARIFGPGTAPVAQVYLLLGAAYGIAVSVCSEGNRRAGAVVYGLGIGLAGWVITMAVILPMMIVGLFENAPVAGIGIAGASLVLHLALGALTGAAHAALCGKRLPWGPGARAAAPATIRHEPHRTGTADNDAQ